MIKPLISALVLLATPAVAQETRCIPTEQAYAYFESKKAIPVFRGDFQQGMLEVWAEHDADGPIWVAFVTFADGRSCLLTEGVDFEAQELPPNI